MHLFNLSPDILLNWFGIWQKERGEKKEEEVQEEEEEKEAKRGNATSS